MDRAEFGAWAKTLEELRSERGGIGRGLRIRIEFPDPDGIVLESFALPA